MKLDKRGQGETVSFGLPRLSPSGSSFVLAAWVAVVVAAVSGLEPAAATEVVEAAVRQCYLAGDVWASLAGAEFCRHPS